MHGAGYAVLVLLLALSAFFSGSETAIFSLNHLERDRLRRERKGKFAIRVLDEPEQVLITILMGNMVVNLLFASLVDGVVSPYFEESTASLYSVLIATALLLVFGEMTPKNIAIRHAVPFFTWTTSPLSYVHAVLTPIRTVLEFVQRRVVSFLSGRVREEGEDRRSLITSTLQAGLQKGLVHPSEVAAAESFLEFREKTAEDIMIPRTALRGVDVESPLAEVIGLHRAEGGRGPVLVYDGDIDHIRGYLTSRDLLAARFGVGDQVKLSAAVRSLHPVPQTKNLLVLMQEMIEQQTEIALAVDEYGGTAGVVPFRLLVEDFLQFFYPRGEEVTATGEGGYRLPGEFRIEELEVLLGVELRTESRTVAGLMTEALQEIPGVGRTLTLAGHVFEVRRVSQKRILEVEVRKT